MKSKLASSCVFLSCSLKIRSQNTVQMEFNKPRSVVLNRGSGGVRKYFCVHVKYFSVFLQDFQQHKTISDQSTLEFEANYHCILFSYKKC